MRSYKNDDNRKFRDLMKHSLIFVEEAMIFIYFFRQILNSIKEGKGLKSCSYEFSLRNLSRSFVFLYSNRICVFRSFVLIPKDSLQLFSTPNSYCAWKEIVSKRRTKRSVLILLFQNFCDKERTSRFYF